MILLRNDQIFWILKRAALISLTSSTLILIEPITDFLSLTNLTSYTLNCEFIFHWIDETFRLTNQILLWLTFTFTLYFLVYYHKTF